jgi:hypothetical protein
MITAIILAVVTATATASPAPAATAPNAQPAAPLREVVYKVVTSLRTSDSSEAYGGYNAPAPGSSGTTGTTGTVTVDIMAVGADGSLGVRVTELWNNLTVARPISFDGAVAPDGSVEFDPSTIHDVTRELLSYFGTRFAPADGLAANTAWRLQQPYANGMVTTDYSVTAVNGSVVTIQKKQTIKGYDVSSEGTIQYEATTLAPISGHIVSTMRTSFTNPGSEFGSESDTARERTLTLRFDRVSDTHSSAQH